MRQAAIAGFFAVCAGCGYIGPIVPPSPELPNAITNLAVVERGDQLVITFDTPPRTTDALPIKRFSDIDLRIGPAVTPFDFDRWAASAKRYEVPVPGPNDADDPKPKPISKRVPASDWQGQRVAVAVRTAVKKEGHFSQWSNRVALAVIQPLERPVLRVEATRDGYKLTWPEQQQEGLHYEVLRQGSHENAPVQIGEAEKPEYLDSTSQWDTQYVYTVVAQLGTAESPPSEPVTIIHSDTFAPSVPSGTTALAGPDSIEVSWSRSPESNLKGYYLYRSVDGGPLTRVGGLFTLPAYSDRSVEHGKKYGYAVSSVSQKNYESEKSAIAEVGF